MSTLETRLYRSRYVDINVDTDSCVCIGIGIDVGLLRDAAAYRCLYLCSRGNCAVVAGDSSRCNTVGAYTRQYSSRFFSWYAATPAYRYVSVVGSAYTSSIRSHRAPIYTAATAEYAHTTTLPRYPQHFHRIIFFPIDTDVYPRV